MYENEKIKGQCNFNPNEVIQKSINSKDLDHHEYVKKNARLSFGSPIVSSTRSPNEPSIESLTGPSWELAKRPNKITFSKIKIETALCSPGVNIPRNGRNIRLFIGMLGLYAAASGAYYLRVQASNEKDRPAPTQTLWSSRVFRSEFNVPMYRTLFIVWVAGALVASICGQEKIIGGRLAPEQRAPYLVSLMYDFRHYCGGTIIGPQRVLTAAHCVLGRRPGRMAIRAGSNLRRRGGFVTAVQGWRRHPRFNSNTLNYDVAIVYLRNRLPFNNRISPIGLRNQALRANQRGVITGWGSTREGGRPADHLQIAAIRVTPQRRCRRAYGRLLRRSMYCAGFVSGIRDACQGDSGGPFVIQGRLAGIISVGNGCGRRGFPGLYTRVPMLRQWIRNT